jgi:hypothetical protein
MHLSPTAGFQKQIADSGVANSIMGGGGQYSYIRVLHH